MRTWWGRSSVRARIALWFAGALTAILVIYSVGIYVWLDHSLVSRVDEQLHEDYEAAEENLKPLPDRKVSWTGVYEHGEDALEKGTERWLDVWDMKGQVLYSNKPGEVTSSPFSAGCTAEKYHYETVKLPGSGSVRTMCGTHTIGDIPAVIQVTRSLDPVYRSLGALILIIGIALPIAIGASGVGGYLLAKRALAPIGKMVQRAKTITADRLTERLPVENSEDELGDLASTFNDTFARLQQSFEQMRRFTADASHELRTPLTAIRSVGEVYLRKQEHGKHCSEVVVSMLEEVHRMHQLIESLLTLSRADAGQVRRNAKSADLGELAKDVVKHLGVLAEEKKQHIRVQSQGAIMAMLDPAILRHAVVNLVDNAIKYSPENSEINVNVRGQDGKAVLEVKDHGPGISPEDHSRVFDRFYRVDKSRSRDLGGFGLGLSIAKWAVEINDGKLELDSREGSGSSFRITFPLKEETV